MLNLVASLVWFGLAISTMVTKESSVASQFLAQLTLGIILLISAFKQF
ncbi:hypothetical protein CPT_Melville_269 [Salmonella phage Melville]|uniref:Acridine resistance protein n=1 Tax=Salmonella phage Melville TaxID=2041413 RepID=A0A2D1GMC6_9CAUD|nr:hypothetical protein FDI73_gp132 [Salmonella phage Melville]ATN93232.1 hypothetical protein CPT_Melville_269 [Salmonella phage Melville]UPW42369.1 hypothetical protein EBPHNEJP_00071 [Salmonella phage CF-SP2]WKV23604.1 hypothetical protein SEA1_gp0256 [Salmonella phage SEA1]